MKTIVFTGGHHNSALVVAESLLKQGYKVAWIGHKFTMKEDKQVSAEYQEVTAAGIPFYELKTGKFYRQRNPLQWLKILFGFVQAFAYLISIRPSLIISFGGYLSVPVVIIGWLLRIPSVTHEQTVTAGWANRAVSPFVRKIFLTHAASAANYPPKKTVVTGLPLRQSLVEDKKYSKPSPKLIYITLGKQGSQPVNQIIFPIIPDLVKKYKVVHQTGAHTITADQDKARRVRNSLPKHLRSRYIHKPYFFEKEAARFFKTASLVIARGGAHTVYELLYLNKKSIIIPITWVSHQEQLKNAQLLEKHGTAQILDEKTLTSADLLDAVNRMFALKVKKRKTLPVEADATRKIMAEVTPLIS